MNDNIQEQSLRSQFVQMVTDQVGKGVYVWGGNGEILDGMADPEDWIARHETCAENAKRALRLIEQRRKNGVRNIRAFDCSGLVY